MNIDISLVECPDGTAALYKGGKPAFCPFINGVQTRNTLDPQAQTFIQKQACNSGCANFQVILSEKKECFVHIRCGAGAVYLVPGVKVEDQKSGLAKV